MKKAFLLIALLIPVLSVAGDDRGKISFGAWEVSKTVVSTWLWAFSPTAPQTEPLVLAYFNGAAGWHDRQWDWQFDGSEKNQERTNYRWVSDSLTLSIAVSGDKKSCWIQNKMYDLAQGNVFLVRNADRGPKEEQVVVMGTFDLTNPSGQPLAVFLLRKYPELRAKLE